MTPEELELAAVRAARARALWAVRAHSVAQLCVAARVVRQALPRAAALDVDTGPWRERQGGLPLLAVYDERGRVLWRRAGPAPALEDSHPLRQVEHCLLQALMLSTPAAAGWRQQASRRMGRQELPDLCRVSLPTPQQVERHGRQRALDRLESLVVRYGIEAEDLDELVRDHLHERAAVEVNRTDEAACADEALHDEADEAASRVNNEGTRGQLEHLLDAYGERHVTVLLHQVSPALPTSGRAARGDLTGMEGLVLAELCEQVMGVAQGEDWPGAEVVPLVEQALRAVGFATTAPPEQDEEQEEDREQEALEEDEE